MKNKRLIKIIVILLIYFCYLSFCYKVNAEDDITSELLKSQSSKLGISSFIEEAVSIGRDANECVSTAVINYLNKDVQKANLCISDSEHLVERTEVLSRNSTDLGQNASISTGMIAGSLRRIAEYAMDLSELAINAAMD